MMEAKRLIASLCFLVPTLLGTMGYAENIPVNKNWDNEIDNRSLSSCPTLVKEGNTPLILSDETVENLSIAITSGDGKQIYWELHHATVDMELVIPIDFLPKGDYYITVMQGSKYIIGNFHVDE